MIGRRGVLAGGIAAIATPAFAQIRPRPRPDRALGGGQAGDFDAAIAALIAKAGLGGTVGFAAADLASGQIVSAKNEGAPLPPASVTKAVTALFALNALGAQHRFATQVLATGPVQGGVVQGDLALAGGGDPSLDTDRLGDLALALAQAGVRRISGQFLVWDGALPRIDRIDGEQPDHVGYNPTISGMILNFNRAQFVWGRRSGAQVLGVNAEGARFNPTVRSIEVVASQRAAPLFRYEASAPRERWSVAIPALNKSGSRWMPVRNPAAYAGDVFATLCAAQGIDLPPARAVASLPQGAQVLVADRSEPMEAILRGMLRFSTNLTAESVGLTASRGANLAESANVMSSWARGAFGTSARFVDHSGLGAASVCTPMDMLRIMQRARGLDVLLRERRIDGAGREAKDGGIRVLAKSGTLNFTSNLAGYAVGPSGRALAFAIFAADSPRRSALPMSQREDPPGAADWNKAARAMQRGMVATWVQAFG